MTVYVVIRSDHDGPTHVVAQPSREFAVRSLVNMAIESDDGSGDGMRQVHHLATTYLESREPSGFVRLNSGVTFSLVESKVGE